MNIRPQIWRASQPDLAEHRAPPTQACLARVFSCREDARAAAAWRLLALRSQCQPARYIAPEEAPNGHGRQGAQCP
jgi:hypothetical protein